jgi:diguanylate cyclase (GGDEF)-like protein
VDQGVIASLLKHPLGSALVIVDEAGIPLASNAAAEANGMARTLSAYAPQLAGVRAEARIKGLVSCRIPGGRSGFSDGWLSVIHSETQTPLAYVFSTQLVFSDFDLRWRTPLESAGLGLWEWDIAADAITVSARWQNSPLSSSGHSFGFQELLEQVHPDERHTLKAELDTHLTGNTEAYACQFRLRQNDGSWRWVLGRGHVVERAGDGAPLRMSGTHTDIAIQKTLESRLFQQQQQLAQAHRLAGVGTWLWDCRQRRMYWSSELHAALRIEGGGLPVNRRWLKQLSSASRAQLWAGLRRSRREAQPYAFDIDWSMANSGCTHLRIWLQHALDDTGGLAAISGQVQNISEQQQTDALIRWRTELLNRVSALGKIGGCEIEVASRSMQWTEECYRIHGLRKEPLSLDAALALYTQDSRDNFEAALTRIAAGGLPEQLELCFYRSSGQRVWVQALIELDRRDGLPERFVVLFRDITRERETSERIELLAHYDLLTGLPNRNLLREQGSQAMEDARSRGTLLAMLFIDLDGFKAVNDSYGYATGDILLKAAASRLHQSLRNSDLFGRFSGDEFIVILRDLAAPEDAGRVARKLIASLAEPLYRGDVSLKVGASVGIALLDEGRADFDSLLRAADTAMYAAKEAGRNTYQYYSQDALLRIQRKLEIERALHGAVERDEFALMYQPLVNTDDTHPPAVEALLRWNHAALGFVSPAEFIPIAEKCGEIGRIGDWVLNEACRQACAWAGAGLVFDRIAVNVSAMQLRDSDFAERVIEICAQNGWSPQRLELELTESALILDSDVLRQSFDTFDTHGVPLAVDDFGTGFSNLHYLNRFPVQRLKIDRSFVQGMLHDAGTAEVTQAIIHLGHALGMQVVAEGVESEQEEALLRRQGCDEIQGYLYSRPLPPRELAEWLRDGRHRWNSVAAELSQVTG